MYRLKQIKIGLSSRFGNRLSDLRLTRKKYQTNSGVASSISEGDIFIYSCSGQLISFEIKSISKELNRAEHKYMNMSPSLIELATPLRTKRIQRKISNVVT